MSYSTNRLLIGLPSWACPSAARMASAQMKSAACPEDDTGLRLPAGFCATVFADAIGHARHLVVAANGVVYVNTWSGRYYGNDKPHAGGFLVALQDTNGSGKANVNQRFGETVQSGGAGGTGIGLYKGALYAEINDRIVRYALPAGSNIPRDPPQTVVSGLPLGGDHPMHPFAIDADGVDVCRCRAPRRIPASRKIANPKSRARCRARNLKHAAASGAMTRIRPARHFHPPNASPRESATAKASESIPPGTAFL